jgi:hypothetical protein
MKNKKLLAIGILLALVSIVIAVSFQFINNHRWYWNAAPLYSIIVMLAAASGGFLVAYSLTLLQERNLWLLIPAGVFGLAWLIIGISAFGLAFPSMNYFSGDTNIGWSNYYGDYLIGWFNIRALQLSVVAGLLGGFLLGRALRK